MKACLSFFVVVVVICTWDMCAALELKFDLGDSRKDCFYQQIDHLGDNIDITFHVLNGGQRDVTLDVLAPNKSLIVRKPRERGATLNIKAMQKGVYTFCFSNEFSSFTHKLVYMDISTESARYEKALVAKEEKKIIMEKERERDLMMTAVEFSLVSLGKNLKRSGKGLKKFRMQDWLSEFHARNLSYNVDAASVVVAALMVLTSLVQTFVLRRFFSGKPSINSNSNKRPTRLSRI